VRDIGLNAASDTIIWEYAKRHDYLSVSKDADFRQRSFLLGYPAKVVWIRRGNCSTTMVESILRNHAADIQTFEADPVAAFLILF
jgi:predicted nuclease of predicted toxin-antitoxin system